MMGSSNRRSNAPSFNNTMCDTRGPMTTNNNGRPGRAAVWREEQKCHSRNEKCCFYYCLHYYFVTWALSHLVGTDFGRSIGSPQARETINCDSMPMARDTEKSTV
jgi:hypothetical protein